MQISGRRDGDGAAEARQHAAVAPPDGVGQPRECEATGDSGEFHIQEQVGCIRRRDAKLQHEQRRCPQADAVGRGLCADARHERNGETLGVKQQIAPGCDLLLGRMRWQLQFRFRHLQRPRQRLPRLLRSALRNQPMRGFRHPGAHDKSEGGGNQPNQKQAAPTDGIGGEGGEGGRDHNTKRNEHGDQAANEATHAGGHELLHQRQIDAIQSADAESDEETENRQEPPAVIGRERQHTAREGEVDDGADKDFPAPIDIREPAPDDSAQDGAHAGRQQNNRRLPEGEVPGFDNEGEHEADQVIIEEFQHVADDRGGNDFNLVARKRLGVVQATEHGTILPVPAWSGLLG